VALGQFASYLLDHGYSYRPVMLIAGLLHVTAFGVIMVTVPQLRPLALAAKARAHDALLLVLKLQVPAIAMMLLGLIVVQLVMGAAVNYRLMIGAGVGLLVVYLVLLTFASRDTGLAGIAGVCILLAAGAAAAKIGFVWDGGMWGKDQAFASCCVAVSVLADLILLCTALSYLVKRNSAVRDEAEVKVMS
jgi:hypothetical protein